MKLALGLVATTFAWWLLGVVTLTGTFDDCVAFGGGEGECTRGDSAVIWTWLGGLGLLILASVVSIAFAVGRRLRRRAAA